MLAGGFGTEFAVVALLNKMHLWLARGSGVGKALIEALIERALSAGMHVMVGAIDGANYASIRFHERLGFSTVAVMPQVGRKFDQWLDLVLMQRILDDPS